MTQVKTNQILATYHNQERTVFNIPKKVYLSNWRLINVGCSSNKAVNYQALNGVLGLIQRITLFQDNLPIDELRDAHSFLAFQQMRKSNTNNVSLEQEKMGTIWGFDVEKYSSATDVNKAILGFFDVAPIVAVGDTDLTKAWVSLQKMLLYLQADNVVPAMNNLRLVIEWRTDVQNVFRGTVAGDTTMTIHEPSLLVDEVVDEKVVKQLSGKQLNIPYIQMEKDSIVVDAVADGVKSPNNYRLNGFNNKFVRRMLLVNEFAPTKVGDTDDNKRLMKNGDCSASQHDERLQVRTNGANRFTGNGIYSFNRKLDLLAQTWGDMNILQGTQYDGFESDHTFLETSNAENLVGRCSYGGWLENQRINDLEIQYERKGSTVPPDSIGTTAFTLSCWAEVQRVLNVDKMGNAMVAYA